jgi:hypothetical protein
MNRSSDRSAVAVYRVAFEVCSRAVLTMNAVTSAPDSAAGTGRHPDRNGPAYLR